MLCGPFASRPTHVLQKLRCRAIPDSPVERGQDLQGVLCVKEYVMACKARSSCYTSLGQLTLTSHSLTVDGSTIVFKRDTEAGATIIWTLNYGPTVLSCHSLFGCNTNGLGQDMSIGSCHVRSEPEYTLDPVASQESDRSSPNHSRVLSNGWAT